MDFGINVDFAVRRGSTHEGSFQEAFELVDLAEAMGIDTVWLGEGHFRPERSVLSAPIVVAGAIATRTIRTLRAIRTFRAWFVVVRLVLVQVRDDVRDVEEPVALEAEVDERRLHPGQDF